MSIFATNHLCLLAAPGVMTGTKPVLDVLLDPSLRLATSTPKIDPAGDYTWMLFRKAEQIRPGAYDMLDQKALKLMGPPGSDGKSLGVLDLLSNPPKSDLVIAYCSYGELAAKKVPGTTWVRFPPELDVPSQYGIGISPGADQRASQFVRFILGSEGGTILKQYGFSR